MIIINNDNNYNAHLLIIKIVQCKRKSHREKMIKYEMRLSVDEVISYNNVRGLH